MWYHLLVAMLYYCQGTRYRAKGDDAQLVNNSSSSETSDQIRYIVIHNFCNSIRSDLIHNSMHCDSTQSESTKYELMSYDESYDVYDVCDGYDGSYDGFDY